MSRVRGTRRTATGLVSLAFVGTLLAGCSPAGSNGDQSPQSQAPTKPARVENVEDAGSQASGDSDTCPTLPRVEVTREAVEGYTVAEEFLTGEAYGDPVEGAPEIKFSREEELFESDDELIAKVAVSTRLFGVPVDTGVREFATGDLGLNAAGAPSTYVIAEDDALEAIATRFCVPMTYLTELNWNRSYTSPGEEVFLLPTP